MKNEQKHTPGPWKTGTKHPTRVFPERGGNIVAHATHFAEDEDSPTQEEIANAKLIASAPDMLEALLAAQRAFSCLQPLEFAALAEKARKLADAAILKATDETP